MSKDKLPWPMGRKIVDMREATSAEMAEYAWEHERPAVVLVLDDGSTVFPSRDSEGNGPGVFFGTRSGCQYILQPVKRS